VCSPTGGSSSPNDCYLCLEDNVHGDRVTNVGLISGKQIQFTKQLSESAELEGLTGYE